MSAKLFDSGDGPYQDWMCKHSQGLVGNTGRNDDSSMFTVHRARCKHITAYGPNQLDGCFTKSGTVKVCSLDAGELADWATQNRPMVTQTEICRSCKPCY